LRLPPIGFRKAKGGGILLEIQCKEHEEEKAEQLTKCIKEVVGSVEGARVRCPLRRLRLKLVGLPFNATAFDISETFAKSGEGGRSGGHDAGGPASDIGVRGGHCLDRLPE